MQLKIGIIGSCTSRDPFTTFYNKDYKTYFKVVLSAQRTSVISFMSKPFDFNEKKLKVIQNGKHIPQRTNVLLYDFNRCAFKGLQQKKLDYLIIDNYFDVWFGIMCINNKFMVTNNTTLQYTDFLNNLKEKKTITIDKNTDEYFKLYQKYCDKFFKYIETNLPNVKIILNKPKLVYNVLTKNGEIYTDYKYKSYSEKYNPLISKLDKYIEKNYTIDTIEFDKDTLAYEDHRWGKAAVHYIDSYYTNFINEVKYLCLSDRIQNLNNKLIKNINKEENFKTQKQEDISETNNLFDKLNNYNQFFDKYASLNNTLDKKYTTLLEENTKFKDTNVNLVNLNKKYLQENQDLTLDINNKKNEIKQLQDENEKLVNLTIEINKQLFDLNLTIKHNEEKINYLLKEKNYLKSQINDLDSKQLSLNSSNIIKNVKKFF